MQNRELELAQNFVEKTNRNLFLTGKAGTGKTTFLRHLQKNLRKRMIVVAPTGVASINARGVTIHSFFQLSFGVFVPNSPSPDSLIKRKFSRLKINIIRSLDLLIIDEVSMVRADVLDAIDELLRRYKNRNKPFGGVQMLFIGDLQQLSPVVRPDEWNILSSHYQTAYFFSSLAYQKAEVISIELQHIYRQRNQQFIKILNEIRHNALTHESACILNKQYNPSFTPAQEDGYITLTTHNKQADKINCQALGLLTTESKTYSANITGEFAENSYPIDKDLTLKIHAQVMFVKNDTSEEKRFFNGKIGKIVALETDKVVVQCGEEEIIEVGFASWEKINYSLDKDTQAIVENLEGTFTQIPLRLAWAITIHKSQGLTFEKAVIDAGSAFAHGQTYVALSRCKTLEGIVLKTPIKSSSIISDAAVTAFNNNMAENKPDDDELKKSQKQFQLALMEELFDYRPLLYPINRLLDLYDRHKASLQGSIIEPLQKIKIEGIAPLIEVADKFKAQLQVMSVTIESLEQNKHIQERFSKAVAYFKRQTDEKIKQIFATFAFSSDSQAINKDFERQTADFTETLQIKMQILDGVSDRFSIQELLEVRAQAMLAKPEAKNKKRPEVRSTTHTQLFEELRLFRLSQAESNGIPAYQVFTQKSLFALCELLPLDKSQLKQIHGMGRMRIEKYGDEILAIINNYAQKNNLESRVEVPQAREAKKATNKESKPNTKSISLSLFKEGLSIKEIAQKRGLVNSTIEGHLAHFVALGSLDIAEIIAEEKLEKGIEIVANNDFSGLSDLKEMAGHEFSYAELRMLVNHVKSR